MGSGLELGLGLGLGACGGAGGGLGPPLMQSSSAMAAPAKSSWLSVPKGMSVRAPFVERQVMLSATCVALMFASCANSVAANPATAGVAIEVPG